MTSSDEVHALLVPFPRTSGPRAGHDDDMGLGLPGGWESVAQRVTEQYGHELVLAPAPDAFNENGGMIDLYLDGKRAGALEFIWDDQGPRSQVLAELWNRITELLAQDLGGGI